MSLVLLTPRPGYTPSIGYGQVIFESPNAPVVNQGDEWQLILMGQTPNRLLAGAIMPWETSYTSLPTLDATGSTILKGTCSAPGEHTVNDGTGVGISVGILPGGVIGPWGYEECSYGTQAATAAPPVLGIPNLVSAVEASWTSHVRVADPVVDALPANSVSYYFQPFWSNSPVQGFVPTNLTLNDQATQAIISFLGGTMTKLPPVGMDLSQLVGPAPTVNWITNVMINGVPSKAMASTLAAAFNTRQAPGGILPAITAAFGPA